MLSRVADSIYWMARYVERAENLSRLLLSTQDLLLDAGAEGLDEEQFWRPILATTGDEEAYTAVHKKIKGRDVAAFVALRPENPNSILNSIRAARENARTVRDQISDDVWECLNGLRLFVESNEGRSTFRNQNAAFYERVLRRSYQFQGIADSTTPRGEVWHFLRLGTCIERADQMSRLIDTCSAISMDMPPHPQSRPLRWAALLRSCSAWHAFQAEHSKLDPKKIIEYLLLDETFPRSVACCVVELHQTLQCLCGVGSLHHMPAPVRRAGRLRSDLAYTTVDEVLAFGLHEYIDALQTRLNDIGEAIFQTFVLYADLTPLKDDGPLESTPTQPLGAYHVHSDEDAQIQQQQ
ncbi:alpha-E domain-containing protein [Prosthecobacter sp.]|uniref:alpha-E domain-containing protein n=1 Tax=Prosthecobacter sp. TaxID=1965333 RepID=UPI001E12838F|nr:alpha-E domain-containing protein [Prosthecobacter sp.]MCB1277859.1 alpha-E domain-containing protein [Prosthecobacter sp.]